MFYYRTRNDRPVSDDTPSPPQKKAKSKAEADYFNPMDMLTWITKEDPNDGSVVPMGGLSQWHRERYPSGEEEKKEEEEDDIDDKMLMRSLQEKGIPILKKEDLPKPSSRLPLEHEMTDEELWKFECLESEYGTVDIEPYRHELQKLREYHRQCYHSKGYDIDEMPNIGVPGWGPLKLGDCCPQRWPDRYEMYKKLAQFALDESQDTKFKVSEVKSVNVTVNACVTYLITFIADDVSDCSKTFQAAVRTWIALGSDEKFKSVLTCGIKGT